MNGAVGAYEKRGGATLDVRPLISTPLGLFKNVLDNCFQVQSPHGPLVVPGTDMIHQGESAIDFSVRIMVALLLHMLNESDD